MADKFTFELARRAVELSPNEHLRGTFENNSDAIRFALACEDAAAAKAVFAGIGERAYIETAIMYDRHEAEWREFAERYAHEDHGIENISAFENAASNFSSGKGIGFSVNGTYRSALKVFLMTDHKDMRALMSVSWSDTAKFFAGIDEPQYDWLRERFAKQINNERKATNATA